MKKSERMHQIQLSRNWLVEAEKGKSKIILKIMNMLASPLPVLAVTLFCTFDIHCRCAVLKHHLILCAGSTRKTAGGIIAVGKGGS